MAEAVVDWRVDEDGQLRPYVVTGKGRPIAATWAPQEGSQRAFLECQAFECLYEGTRGPGKRLSDDEVVLTDSGWKRIGNVSYADKLVARDGTYTSIIGIFRSQSEQLYRVTFEDGASVVADADHLWTVYSRRNGARDGEVVRTTRQLLESDLSQWAIPLLDAPAPGKKWEGPDPYILGLLLGDGTLTGQYTTLYTADQYIHDYVCARGWRGRQYKPGVWMLYCSTDEQYRDVLGRVSREAKHVPQELLDADPHTRLRLLQGLMDSDGYCDKEGRCGAKTISPQLADAYVYLIRSLGGKSSKRLQTFPEWENRKPIWRVSCSHANKFNPFAMPRKADRVTTVRTHTMRAIRTIEPSGPGPATCFTVDHPGHLYVTRDFVLTHNTDTLIMDFAQHCGPDRRTDKSQPQWSGWGAEWRGILFRQTFPQLSDVIVKTKKWFPLLFPEAKYNESTHTWSWPTGETLRFAYGAREADYWNYHGHSWPWMAFEELTTWNDPGFFLKMQSCCRSTVVGIPKKLRATTNPYGPGHNWVKARYHLPLAPGRIEGPLIFDKGEDGKPLPERMAIHGYLDENKILLMADPEYKSRIRAAARNKAELAAWMDGSWDIVAGGMFDDVWNAKRHVVPAFDIPHSWRIDRSFDWGSSRPFSVGWWAESDGSDIRLRDGRVCSTVRGDLFRIGEWYGWTGQPNEGKRMLATDIAKGIVERELALGIHGRCKAGPADAAVFKTENGVCIANDLMTPVIVNGEKRQIRFVSSNSAPGTRKIGWELMRRRFLAAAPQEGHRGPREFPGLFVFDRCEQFRRTVPVLPRDDKDLDDVDSDTEDHIADESRYRCMFSQWRPKSGTVVGVAG